MSVNNWKHLTSNNLNTGTKLGSQKIGKTYWRFCQALGMVQSYWHWWGFEVHSPELELKSVLGSCLCDIWNLAQILPALGGLSWRPQALVHTYFYCRVFTVFCRNGLFTQCSPYSCFQHHGSGIHRDPSCSGIEADIIWLKRSGSGNRRGGT